MGAVSWPAVRARRSTASSRCSPPSPRKEGYALVGASGAGHFTKMVHNGVEYAMLQGVGEGRVTDACHQDRVSALIWHTATVVPQRLWVLATMVGLAFAIELGYRTVTGREIHVLKHPDQRRRRQRCGTAST